MWGADSPASPPWSMEVKAVSEGRPADYAPKRRSHRTARHTPSPGRPVPHRPVLPSPRQLSGRWQRAGWPEAGPSAGHHACPRLRA